MDTQADRLSSDHATSAGAKSPETQADRLSSGYVTSADAISPEKDCAELNSLLRGEISAVDTYSQCIEKLDDPDAGLRLEALKRSHALRRDWLTNQIRLLGGTPEEHAGLWGAMASFLEGGATIFGEKAALKVLEEGEMHGLRHYEAVDGVSSATRVFISTTLLPEQQRTAAALALLVQGLG